MTELPARLSCNECRDQGDNIIHFSFECVLDTGEWYWHIMNHDKTSKFKWPKSFKTKPRAVAFVQSLLDEAKEGDEGA